MPQIKKIDHIGIVIHDLNEGIKLLQKLLLKESSHTEHVAASKVELAFFDIAGVQLELLAPTAPNSEVSPFLEQTRGGIHHICYEVDSVQEMLSMLKEEGFMLIDEKPRSGSRGTKIGFVDTLRTIGFYTEYCEYPK